MTNRTTGTTPTAQPPLCLPPDPHPRKPRHRLPPGATDCHCHVYEDPQRYPYVADRSYTPAPADRQAYLAMCATLGLERTVQVSASVYGSDNRLTLDLIAALGQHRARGVAGLSPQVEAAELHRLHEGGMRGVRVSTLVKGYGGTDAIAELAPRIRPLGWHLQLHFHHAEEIAQLEPMLLRLAVPLVFDHMGCVDGRLGPDQPGFQAMLRILRQRDDCWAKISSWHRRSHSGPPGYTDMRPLVEAMVDARADRLVFGTNWPNPALFAPDTMPNDGDMVDLFCDWVPDAAVRQAILSDNPARLYGFPPLAG
ncbi:amidohydrolase family protein [Xylophilus rhododendri]|uniref:Amidohydrolase family protein n=1 Tax=Xylophilus rhododendri TaxID=2697032 RepID=A0A857JEA5_9BURK|nr:amidohydrolase family protein [Xylophilus rhododendri]QHJ01273.1 amidohydrolase family protein [Xylophilus rhododendri]